MKINIEVLTSEEENQCFKFINKGLVCINSQN